MPSNCNVQVPDELARLNWYPPLIAKMGMIPILWCLVYHMSNGWLPSIFVPSNSLPLITLITRLLVSTTTNPSSGLEKNVGASTGFCGVNANLSPFVNWEINCNRKPSGNIIWHWCKACHTKSCGYDRSLFVLPINSSGDLAYSFNSSTLL